MVPTTTRLTPLLHELEARMDAAGAPFSSRALPGLSDAQIDELLAPSGLTIATELREWWRWHHGSLSDSVTPFAHEIGPGSWGLMTIPEALDDAALWLASSTGEDGDFSPTWLPVTRGAPHHRRLVARLDGSGPDEVCVGYWYVFDIPPEAPVAHSLADVVETWLTALRRGWTRWDGEAWVCDDYRPDFPDYAQS